MKPSGTEHAFCTFSKQGEEYDAEYLLSFFLEYATKLALIGVFGQVENVKSIISSNQDKYQLFISVSFAYALGSRCLITQICHMFVGFSLPWIAKILGRAFLLKIV